MKYPNDTSLYFRLPNEVKKEFEFICTIDRMTMTQTLNHFIRGFIESKREQNPTLYAVEPKQPQKWHVERKGWHS